MKADCLLRGATGRSRRGRREKADRLSRGRDRVLEARRAVKRIAAPGVSMIVRLVFLALALLWARPARALDSTPWDQVLRAHARGGGVDYPALAADPAARADLERFYASLASMGEDEPLGAWLDAYNAIVVHEIVERWPIESVMRVPGFFDRERHRVAGRDRTLDDVEHRVIRARFRDARVHAALVCGARSCPPLHPRALASGDLDATLDRLVRAWLASERHLRIEAGAIRGSAILSWYRADFVRDGGSVVGWIRRYAPERVAALPDTASVAEMPYDWSINLAR